MNVPRAHLRMGALRPIIIIIIIIIIMADL